MLRLQNFTCDFLGNAQSQRSVPNRGTTAGVMIVSSLPVVVLPAFQSNICNLLKEKGVVLLPRNHSQ